MTEQEQAKRIGIIFIVTLILAIGVIGYQKFQYYRTTHTLYLKDTFKVFTSIDPNKATKFRIYPRVVSPVGDFIEFRVPDPLITEFFQSLKDHQLYFPSHNTVISWDQTWFLELEVGEMNIQIAFSIPARKGEIVVGELGRFKDHNVLPYGHFQSRLLFQWYQKYKDRWLNPPTQNNEQ